MRVLGIDLGTTNVAAVLADTEERRVAWTGAREHRATLAGGDPWENRQEPEIIFETARLLLREARREAGRAKPIEALCVSGQMHGILYLDQQGAPLSPLYTWLDARAARPHPDGGSYAERLSARTGFRLAPGFGSATHYYNRRNSLVPAGAAAVATILDYVSMRLCGNSRPVSDATTAASLGLFDLEALRFDKGALAEAGFDGLVLPEVAPAGTRLGESDDGIPVFAPIADNQASFLGAVREPAHSVLVNVGTAGQLSVTSEEARSSAPGMEVRPFPGGGYLHVGAALCSGKAYEQLRTFFRRVLAAFGADERAADYSAMNALAESAGEQVTPDLNAEALIVDTRFAGTRVDPSVTGSIANIRLGNLTPEALTRGYIDGIAGELYEFYLAVKGAEPKSSFIGSGNGLRSSEPLKAAFARRFGRPLLLPVFREEAALGAALCAAVAAGAYPDYRSAGEIVRYES